MQGTQVRSLVQEDFTCRGATKPPELLSPSATWPSTLHALEPVLHSRRRHRHESSSCSLKIEKVLAQQEDPEQLEKKKKTSHSSQFLSQEKLSVGNRNLLLTHGGKGQPLVRLWLESRSVEEGSPGGLLLGEGKPWLGEEKGSLFLAPQLAS